MENMPDIPAFLDRRKPLLGAYGKFGPEVLRLGYDPTPVSGKRAILDKWPSRPEAALEFEKHSQHNLGIVCGGVHNIVAIDVDVTDEANATAIEELILDQLGDAPKRIGKAPKFLYVYRVNQKRKKNKVKVKGGEIEVLAEGQQFVASGIHPDTKKKYDWPNDNLTDYRADELPLISNDNLNQFLTSVAISPPAEPKRQNGRKLELGRNDAQRIREIQTGPQWHNPMVELTASLVQKGLDRETIIDLLVPQRWEGYSEADTRLELGKMVDGAFDKGFAPEIPKLTRRPIQTISEVLNAEPIEWLSDGLIPKTGVGIISGASGSFKSFLCGYLALCVSNGADFADRCATQRGRALFAAHEGRQGMAGRLKAACNHYGFQEEGFGLWDGITLTNTSDIDYLAEEVEPFDLTVIDTLSKATPGIDENSNSEMAAALDRAYQLADLWRGFVLIVSHSGKDESKGPRGASALKANVETVLLVKRSGKAMHTSLVVDKQKDGPDDLRFDFKMEEVNVINDVTGEILTELVPLPSGSNSTVNERIKRELINYGELSVADLKIAVIETARATGDCSVTTTAFTTAISRAKQRGDVVENGGKLRLSGNLIL